MFVNLVGAIHLSDQLMVSGDYLGVYDKTFLGVAINDIPPAHISNPNLTKSLISFSFISVVIFFWLRIGHDSGSDTVVLCCATYDN